MHLYGREKPWACLSIQPQCIAADIHRKAMVPQVAPQQAIQSLRASLVGKQAYLHPACFTPLAHITTLLGSRAGWMVTYE